MSGEPIDIRKVRAGFNDVADMLVPDELVLPLIYQDLLKDEKTEKILHSRAAKVLTWMRQMAIFGKMVEMYRNGVLEIYWDEKLDDFGFRERQHGRPPA